MTTDNYGISAVIQFNLCSHSTAVTSMGSAIACASCSPYLHQVGSCFRYFPVLIISGVLEGIGIADSTFPLGNLDLFF